MNQAKYYTIPDSKDFIDSLGYPRSSTDSSKVFAKALKLTKKKNVLDRSPSYFKYYVKIEPNRSLHNPFDGYSIKKNSKSFIDKICKNENAFMEVNQVVFEKYINFLKTQNIKWLTDAAREIR